MHIAACLLLRFRGRMDDSSEDSPEDRSEAKLAVTLIDIGVRKRVPASEIIFLVPSPFLEIPQIVYEITLPLEKLGLARQDVGG